MDQRTRELVDSKGLIGGIAAYIAAPPEGERYTPLDRVVTAISRVTMFLIFAGVLVTFYEVVMRRVFDSPTLWVNELVLWMGSIVYMAAGAFTMQRRAHIRITAVYDIVPKHIRRAFDYTALFVLTVYATLMIVRRTRCRLEGAHHLGALRHHLRSADPGDDQAAGADRDGPGGRAVPQQHPR